MTSLDVVAAASPLGHQTVTVAAPEETPAMRRLLPPAAAVLLALSACGYRDGEELREELAAVTAAEQAPDVPDSGEGEGREEEDESQEGLFEPVQVPTDLVDAEGSVIGAAYLRDEQRGVTVTVEVSGMTPGYHGMGLYEVGSCTAEESPGEAFGSVGELLLALPPVLVLENGVGITTALIDPAAVIEELIVEDGTAVVLGPPTDSVEAGAPPAGSRAACAAFGEDTPAEPVEGSEEGSEEAVDEDLVSEEDPDAVDRGTGGLDNDEDTDVAVEDGEG